MKTFLIIIFLFTASLIFADTTNVQINTNLSYGSYVLVYNDTTSTIILESLPGTWVETIYTLKEFSSQTEMDAYIQDNNLIFPDNQ